MHIYIYICTWVSLDVDVKGHTHIARSHSINKAYVQTYKTKLTIARNKDMEKMQKTQYENQEAHFERKKV